MSRPTSLTIADLDIMAEAAERLSHVLYAKSYFEKRFDQALERVIGDLGNVARVLLLISDKRDAVEELRRLVANQGFPSSHGGETPTTLPPNLIQL